MNIPDKKSPLHILNVRQFIAFRVFFNSRFYYPVFTILFLDFGLTLSHFALLNAIWAAAIVILEVPSGALADTLGRRKLLIFAGVFMVVEIALICFTPKDNLNLLFTVFLINRLLSGAAEAMASGADEALAYDALKKEGNADHWGQVLEMQMRYQSVAFIVAMSLGAVVYDPELMQRFAVLLGLKVTLTQDITLRFPLYLTLITAVLTLITTLKMREVRFDENSECINIENCGTSVADAFRLTLNSGKWILKTPFALIVILSGLLFDHIIRMLITMNSQYYRLIDLPEASFGLIGSGLAVLGLWIPRIANKLANKKSPAFNLGVITALTLAGLIGMTFFIPIFGLFPVIFLFGVMYFIRFFISHYLNSITDSSQRATVLSFKGLSFNLAYGIIGVLFSFLLFILRSRAVADNTQIAGQGIENRIFIESISWFPWYFIITIAALLLFSRWKLKDTDIHKVPIGPSNH